MEYVKFWSTVVIKDTVNVKNLIHGNLIIMEDYIYTWSKLFFINRTSDSSIKEYTFTWGNLDLYTFKNIMQAIKAKYRMLKGQHQMIQSICTCFKYLKIGKTNLKHRKLEHWFPLGWTGDKDWREGNSLWW